MQILSEKRALITGATGEIGEAIAKELHKNGCEVFLSGTRPVVLEQLATELGSRVHFMPSDLKNRENAQSLIEKCENQMGGIDILINNAGITRDVLFLRMSDDDWNEVIEVNLNSSP